MILQVGFTVVFLMEVILKVWVYGPRGYIRVSRHKFELILAVFSCFNLICCRTVFTYAQVMRVTRLIKASPVLEEFCWKVNVKLCSLQIGLPTCMCCVFCPAKIYQFFHFWNLKEWTTSKYVFRFFPAKGSNLIYQ